MASRGKVSVIITTRNEEGNIRPCLESLLKLDFPKGDLEIIVVDNNSKDATKGIARSYTDKVYDFGPERAAQRNFGARQATGKYILYLDADMILSNNVIFECVQICEESGDIALYIPERIIGNGFWIRVRDFERSFYNTTVVDAARFIRKDKFLEVGGFDETLTGPEDWDLDRRLKTIGKIGIIGAPIYHNEGRFSFKRYFAKKAYYSQWFEKYVQKWGRDDAIVRRQLGFCYRYFGVFLEKGKWLRLIIHPALSLGMFYLRIITGFAYLIRGKVKNGILILTPFFAPNVGGVETHLNDLTAYLAEEGYYTYILTYKPITSKINAPYFTKTRNLEISRLPWFGFNLFSKLEPFPILEFLYITPWLLINAFIFLLFKKNFIKVIHAQGLNSAFIGALLKVIFRKRLVVSTHAVYEMNPYSFMARFSRGVLNLADEILALSEASRRELVRIGIPQEKIKVYSYWVNQDIFKPLDKQLSKKHLGWLNKFIVLFVGRFIEKKGTDILCRIAKRTSLDINFAFIGDGPLSEYLYQESRINKNIIHLGKIDNAKLGLYYNAADLLCVPSKYEEGLGRVILEALCCGLPVVASDKGGIPEVLNENIGILVEPKENDFYLAIERLYRDQALRRKLSENALYYAKERFSDKNAKVITEAYRLSPCLS